MAKVVAIADPAVDVAESATADRAEVHTIRVEADATAETAAT